MGHTRDCWVHVGAQQWIAYVFAEHWDGDPDAPTQILVGNGRSRRFNLTSLTEAELLLLQEFWNRVIGAALPLAREADRKAKEDWENGEAHRRIYRDVPTLAFRPGSFIVNDEGVPDGFDPDLWKRFGSRRGSDSGASDGDAPDVQTDNVAPEVGGSEELRGVEGQAELPGELQGADAGSTDAAPDAGRHPFGHLNVEPLS